jgi:hypothetical protein
MLNLILMDFLNSSWVKLSSLSCTFLPVSRLNPYLQLKPPIWQVELTNCSTAPDGTLKQV